MTDTEYMEMIEAEWINPSDSTDSTDFFDDVNCYEEMFDWSAYLTPSQSQTNGKTPIPDSWENWL